jgi:hypothetical protein
LSGELGHEKIEFGDLEVVQLMAMTGRYNLKCRGLTRKTEMSLQRSGKETGPGVRWDVHIGIEVMENDGKKGWTWLEQ